MAIYSGSRVVARDDNAKENSQRGNIALFVEVIVVICIILAFLIAVKVQSGRRDKVDDQGLPQSVYPTTPIARVTAPPYVPETIPERTEPYEIIYTDAGFSPDVTQIASSNRVVIFRNNSTHVMRLVADRKAGDAAFPDLSQPIDAPTGGTYWFAFPAGAHTYSFYNKSSTNHRGTIIVK